MNFVRIVRSVQLGEARHGCTLCLLTDTQNDGELVYAVAVRMGDFTRYWPHAHLVTPERWGDENLRRVLDWRSEREAGREFEARLATFPVSSSPG